MTTTVPARVLVTGCSTGIGRTTAQVLARRGHEVIATARRPETLAGLDVARALPLDVQDDASVAALLAETGPVDVLVNNAGVAARGPVEAVPGDEALRVFDVNVLGALRMVRAYAPLMRRRGSGTIVNVSSVVGRIAPPLAGVYPASKWALEGLSETLRLELGHFGVRVVVVEPGVVDTGAYEASPVYLPDDGSYAPLAAQLAAGSGGSSPAEDVALAIAEAVEEDGGPLRRPVGAGATQLLAARASMDDEAFDGVLRGAFGLAW